MKSKTLLRLHGGLGNQLFQLSKAIEISDDIKSIKISLKHINKYKTKHENVIGEIVNLNCFGKANFVEDLILSLRLPKIIKFKNKLVSLWSDNGKKNDSTRGRINILDGYFQTEGVERLKNISKYLLAECEETNELVIHLRGQDFYKLGHTTMEIDSFYEQAIRIAQKIESMEKILVITDDATLASTMPSLRGYIIDSSGVVNDFNKIRGAKQKIYNNSTFALTAAVLGSDKSLCLTSGISISGGKREIFLTNEVVVT